jgi:hypothetical protein
MDGLIQSSLYACAVVDHMDALLIAQVPATLNDVLFCWVDDIVCTESLRELLAFFGNLGYDDLLCTFGFQGQNNGDTNRTATQYQNGVAFFVWADLDGVPSDREWFD